MNTLFQDRILQNLYENQRQFQKELLKEYLEDRMSEVNNGIMTIFIWGFMFGVIFAYTNMTSLIVGSVLGYITAKKQIPFIEYGIIKLTTMLNNNKIKFPSSMSNIVD